MKSCVYYGVESAAAFVWDLLQKRRPLTWAELRNSILQEYEVAGEQVEEDLLDLLQSMRNHGLIEVKKGRPAAAAVGENKTAAGLEPGRPYLGMNLIVYGTIEEITRKNGPAGQPDGGGTAESAEDFRVLIAAY